MTMVTRLFVTRHGETEWNLEGRIQGQKDSKLTELGETQAKWLGAKLCQERIDAIVSSSSGRAFRTAELIRGNMPLEIIKSDALREMYLGPWEGMRHTEISERFPVEQENLWHHPHLYQPSEGESYFQLMKRVVDEIKNIIFENKGKNILIVTHAIVLKAILAHFEGKKLEDFWSGAYMHSTCLNIIEVHQDKHVIKLQGDISHYNTTI